MEQKWVDALVKANVATLDSIFADGYVDTDEEGHVGGKQDVLVKQQRKWRAVASHRSEVKGK